VTEAEIQAALNAAKDGDTIVLPKDAVINISKGLLLDVSARSVSVNLNGSTLQQAADVTVFSVKGAHEAASTAKLGVDAAGHVTVDYVGQQKVAVGDWVKVFSDDALPNDHTDGGVPTRLGQAMQIIGIDHGKLILGGDLLYQSAYQTNVRVSAYDSGKAVVENGTINGDQSHPTWANDLLQVRSTVGAVVNHVTVQNGNSMGVNFVDSVNGLAVNVTAKNLTDDPANGHYGYGVHSASSVGTTVNGLYAENVRHATDNNAIGIAPGHRDPSKYGADIGMTTENSIAQGTTSYAYSWHSEARGALIENSMAFDSFGFLGARGIGNTMVDSAGVGNKNGILLYEYGNGDGRHITIDNVWLRETVANAVITRGNAVENTITNSVFETNGKVTLNLDSSNIVSNVQILSGPKPDADTLVGTAGADKLLGGLGGDTIKGGAGADYIWGGLGADLLTGGVGRDRFAYHSISEAGDTITDFKAGVGGDVLDLSVMVRHYGWTGDLVAGGYLKLVQAGADINVLVDTDGKGDGFVLLTVMKNVDGGRLVAANLGRDIVLSDGQLNDGTHLAITGASVVGIAVPAIAIVTPLDLLSSTYGDLGLVRGSEGGDKLFGGDGGVLMTGGGGDDRLTGGTGDDVLDGGTGADTLMGGAGSDTASYLTASSGVTASLNAPLENTGDAAGDRYSQIENLAGSQFGDVLKGNGGGNVLSGFAGNDRLEGLAGNDTLYGGAGDDVLVGGLGRDVLDGGAGKDLFLLEFLQPRNADQIMDFVSGEDHIALSKTAFGISSLAGVSYVEGVNPAATGFGPALLFDTATGSLAWDPDGAGSKAAVEIGVLTGTTHLSILDFVVI
jgi:Ca2+-binding RTX toxin-like protein